MKKRLLLIGSICFVWMGSLYGQSIEKLMPVPKSLRYDAPLPVEKQRKLNRIIQERNEKQIRWGEELSCKSAYLQNCFSRYVRHNDSAFYLNDAPYQYHYSYARPKMVITNSSYGHELIQRKGVTFKAKKDRLSAVYLDDNQRLYVVNRKNELCDPAQFRFVAEKEGIHMEGNRIVMDMNPREIAEGKYDAVQPIVVTHLSSNATYRYDLQFVFEDSLSFRGQKKALALMAYPTPAFPQLGAVLNLTDQTMCFVQLPLTIHGEGTDGIKGHRGYNGANGTHEYWWTDKEGKKHYVAGTCAQEGGDGQDGSNGTDGGQYLLFLDNDLVNSQGAECVTAWTDPGVGGEGGKGGEGGIHGRGSKCKGYAANGRNGHRGKNGQRGDFLYVIGDVQTWFRKALK